MTNLKRFLPLALFCLLVVACSDSGSDWTAERVTETAVSDLATMLGIDESDVIVMTPASSVTWGNGAVGCEQPGMSYDQAQVQGFSLVLAFANQMYPYHQGGVEPPFHCAAPTE